MKTATKQTKVLDSFDNYAYFRYLDRILRTKSIEFNNKIIYLS